MYSTCLKLDIFEETESYCFNLVFLAPRSVIKTCNKSYCELVRTYTLQQFILKIKPILIYVVCCSEETSPNCTTEDVLLLLKKKEVPFFQTQFLRLFPFILQSPNLTFYCGRKSKYKNNCKILLFKCIYAYGVYHSHWVLSLISWT